MTDIKIIIILQVGNIGFQFAMMMVQQVRRNTNRGDKNANPGPGYAAGQTSRDI
jgi:hypothetical protein